MPDREQMEPERALATGRSIYRMTMLELFRLIPEGKPTSVDFGSVKGSIIKVLRERAMRIPDDTGGWRSWYYKIADELERDELVITRRGDP